MANVSYIEITNFEPVVNILREGVMRNKNQRQQTCISGASLIAEIVRTLVGYISLRIL